MSAHTPGPWEYDGKFQVCIPHKEGMACFRTNREDARLIAAAPDLLEALREAENALADYVPTIEKTGASLNYGHAVIRQARAAIAKAEAA